MKKYFFRISSFAALLFISACTHTPVNDEEGSIPDDTLSLQSIMKTLGENMQSISDGISREDWVLVEEKALQVADHPTPSLAEKKRIMNYMGNRMATFKGYDIETHNAASTLSELAAKKNGHEVIAAFAMLQNTCLACHEEFRQEFKQHFHSKP